MPAQRSILITGCSSGIGLCVAKGLQQRGWRVFASARKAADVVMLQQAGLEALQLDVDDSVTDDQLETMCKQLLANMVIENYRIERLPTSEKAA